MYRVAKKTTKRTEDYCLSCEFHKLIHTTVNKLNIIECTAPNKCMLGEFCSRDFYCIEVKNFNEMNKSQRAAVIKDLRDRESLALFREYVNKYAEKSERKSLIKKFKEKLRRNK